MKEVPLKNGFVAIVDDEDYELVSAYKWHVNLFAKQRYAQATFRRNGKVMHIDMHRLIMGFPKQLIDHKNRNSLDNRRQNLRLATKGQNGINAPKAKLHKASSIYKGVFRAAKHKQPCWGALITVNQEAVRLGRFHTEEEAARAYDAAAKQHFGEFAYLNFP